jgi:RNA polymerase sigma-70 factor (ECF subfamily)
MSKRHLHKQVCLERDRLYRLAWSWCHNQHQAEDLVQETQARALAKLDTLRDESRLAVWLTRIMVNLFRDHFRKTKEDTGLEVAELITEEETPEQSIDRSAMIQNTRAAIAQLPDNHRQIITLVDIAGFSYTETSQTLGIPVGTVMSRLSRARKSLHKTLVRQASTDNIIPLRKQS